MPSPRAHEFIDRLFFGKTYGKMHREMDKPFKYPRRGHRVLFHDSVWAYVIASRHYLGDPNAVLAAQYHIFYDVVCSRDRQYRKFLEMLARLGGRRKRRRISSRVLRI